MGMLHEQIAQTKVLIHRYETIPCALAWGLFVVVSNLIPQVPHQKF